MIHLINIYIGKRSFKSRAFNRFLGKYCVISNKNSVLTLVFKSASGIDELLFRIYDEIDEKLPSSPLISLSSDSFVKFKFRSIYRT